MTEDRYEGSPEILGCHGRHEAHVDFKLEIYNILEMPIKLAHTAAPSKGGHARLAARCIPT